MSTDGSSTLDEVEAALNPADEPSSVEGQIPAPVRPAESAPKARWVEHVVALGASRDAVTGGSQHWDSDRQEYVPGEELTKDDLIGLADRLGG